MELIRKAYRVIKEIGYSILINGIMKHCLPDTVYLKYYFRRQLGYSLNLKNPKTFSEKIQWIKLYDHNPLYTLCSDKAAVREVVGKKIGDQYLIPIIGIYQSVRDIDWEKLPEKFVLKMNTGSGYNFICRNKSDYCYEDIVTLFEKWYKEKFYQRHKEYHYKNIKKKIVCESLLEDTSLFDYKVFCFYGIPYLIMVEMGEKYQNHRNLYYPTWERHTGWITKHQDEFDIPRPSCLGEMLEKASILAEGFKEVRVDFYIVKGQLYFGEMTFTSGAGFSTFSSYDFDLEMGSQFSVYD